MTRSVPFHIDVYTNHLIELNAILRKLKCLDLPTPHPDSSRKRKRCFIVELERRRHEMINQFIIERNRLLACAGDTLAAPPARMCNKRSSDEEETVAPSGPCFLRASLLASSFTTVQE
jgi:hypothetical protein